MQFNNSLKQKNLLLPLLMAIVMMAMSPVKGWAEDVASVKIGDGEPTNYESITAAFDAANVAGQTSTITLLADITGNVGGYWVDPCFALTSGTITLDLNDHKLSPSSCNTAIDVNGANLTIIGNGEVKSVKYTSGTLNLCGGTYNTLSVANTSDWDKLCGEGYYLENSNGNAFNGDPYNTSMYGPFVVKSESTITEADANLSVTINGETTYFTDLKKAFAKAAEGTTELPAIVVLMKDINVTNGNGDYYYTLTSGVITFDLNDHKFETNIDYALQVDGATLNIVDNGANKSGEIKGLQYTSGTLKLYAGTISNVLGVSQYSDWANIMGENCVLIKSDGSTFVPGQWVNTFWDTFKVINESAISEEDAALSVTINGETKYFTDFTKAFAKAAEGTAETPATVTLLKDIDDNSSWPEYRYTITSGTIDFDLNGHKFTTGAWHATILVDGATLTVSDNSESKAGELKQIAYNSGALTINGGTFTAQSEKQSFYITTGNLADGAVTLHGGTYTKGLNVNNSANWAKLGMDGYCFLDANGDNVEPEANATSINKQVTVDLVATKIEIYGAQMQNVYGYWAVFGGDEKLGLTLATTSRTDFDGTFTTADMFLWKAQNCTFLCLDGKYYDITSINFTVTVDGSDKTFEGIFYSNGKKYNFMMTTKSKPLPPVSLEIESSVLTPGDGYWSVYGNDGEYYLSLGTNTRTDFDGSFTKSDMYIAEGDGCTYLYTIVAGQPSYKEITDINFTVTKAGEAKTFTGTILTADGLTVNFTMVNRPRLVLDEKAVDLTSYDTETEYDLTVNREMKNGKWNTLCLPFSMTADEVEATFGEGTELKVIGDVTVTDEYVINFVDATEITAGEMYIIKPSSSYNFTITANPKKMSNVSGSKTFGDLTVSTSFYRSDIKEAELSNETATYIMNDEKFYRVNNDIVFKGFRWFVTTPSGEGASYAKIIANIDDTPTEINSISAGEAHSSAMYNLAGQRVNANVKGIIIKNGKKVFIK